MIVSKKINKTYLNSEKNKKGGYQFRVADGQRPVVLYEPGQRDHVKKHLCGGKIP